VDDAAPIDVVKCGVADAPPADVEPVEHGGDLVVLVVLHGKPPPCPTIVVFYSVRSSVQRSS
jgi:hypothetical protein